MGKVYINLHPNYNYATIIIADFIDLREYIERVDWIDWLLEKKRYIHVRSKEVGKHEARTYVFAQRMLLEGHKVLIRNERKDKFVDFQSRDYSEEYMVSIEKEPYDNNHDFTQ